MAGSQAGSCRGWELAVPAGARCLAFLFFLCLWVGGIAIWCRWLRCGQCFEHGGAWGLPVSALLSEGAGCVQGGHSWIFNMCTSQPGRCIDCVSCGACAVIVIYSSFNLM